MYAGLRRASGDFVALMDADLQDPPELLAQMYAGIEEEGYDCVGCRRVTVRTSRVCAARSHVCFISS